MAVGFILQISNSHRVFAPTIYCTLVPTVNRLTIDTGANFKRLPSY